MIDGPGRGLKRCWKGVDRERGKLTGPTRGLKGGFQALEGSWAGPSRSKSDVGGRRRGSMGR